MSGEERVQENRAEHRYEIWAGDDLCGFASYQQRGDHLVSFHTEVDPSHEGEGLGSRLAHETLEDLRAQRRQIVPRCPFIAAYIRHHPEYLDVVEPSLRRALVPTESAA